VSHNALYYPWIDPPHRTTILSAMLYWDHVYSIVPDGLKTPFERPWTKTAADYGFLKPRVISSGSSEVELASREFIDDIQRHAIQRDRRDSLRSGGLGQTQLHAESMDARMHPEKVSHELRNKLWRKTLPDQDGFYSMADGYAAAYMSRLASTVSEADGLVPLTDRSSSSTVLVDRTAGKQMSDRVGQNEALLARLSIESIRIPASTSFKQVLDFRAAHHGELEQYRTAIRKLAREVSGIASVELRLKELKRIVDSELRPADEELRAKLNESRIDFGMSIIRILSAATVGALLSNDIRSGLGVGLVDLGFETFTWRRESKKTKTEPLTYLALLKGRFRPE